MTSVDKGLVGPTLNARLLSFLEKQRANTTTVTLCDAGSGPVLPEIQEVAPSSFNLNGNLVAVSLTGKNGEIIQFAIGVDKFLTGITAAVMFANMHLTQVFDLIGAP